MGTEPEILIAIADTHINHKLALMKLPSRHAKPTKSQRFLSINWKKACSDIADLIAQYKNPWVTTVFDGDLIEADTKKRTNQLVTRNQAFIMEMAFDTLEPVINMSNDIFVIRGTPAHVGKDAEYEEAFAGDLKDDGIIKCEDTGDYSWDRVRGEWGGVMFDIQHQGPIGRLRHTKLNAVMRLASELEIEYQRINKTIIAIRAHNHQRYDTYDNYEVRVIGLPAWQIPPPYVTNTKGKYEISDIGFRAFVCQNGQIEVKKYDYDIPREKTWKRT